MKKNKKVSLTKKPLLVLSRGAIIGWSCFIFFVCAWMFVIGVLVGRGTAPVKFDIAGIQKKLEASQEDLKNKEKSRSQGKSGIVKDKTKLDFYEALRDNRKDTQIAKKKPPLTIGGEAKKKIIKKAEPTESGAGKPSQKPPIASKSKTRPPVTTYTIQVASLKNARDADRLVAELKKKGFHAQRVIGKIPGKGIWYRIRIGDYKSMTSARYTLNKLKKAGLKPIVVEK